MKCRFCKCNSPQLALIQTAFMLANCNLFATYLQLKVLLANPPEVICADSVCAIADCPDGV
jgi:hypothetical protein